MAGRGGHALVGRLRRLLDDAVEDAVVLVTTTLGLGLAIAVVDGVGATSVWSVLLVALAVTLGDVLLRVPLRALARVAGAAGALVAGLVAQVAVVWGALAAVPGIVVASGWAVVGVLVGTAVVLGASRWLWGSSDNEYVVADVLLHARRNARRAGARPPGETRPPGMLVVQLDGVGADVMRQAVDAGLAPTVQRWLDQGSHRLERWWSAVPSTTPAAQAGILHGAADGIPAFRWWDRDLRRLVVTNHPDDAARVEDALSDGRGLLSGGGTAVATMFSGDADASYLVMSRSRRDGLGPGPGYVRFFARPFVLARAVTATAGEIVKELYQARRQRVYDVRPRISRAGWYVLLRGVTNVLLRDLATSLVADALVRGDPVVYVDLVDYDEIAHHAGPTRPESLRALEGLDRVLRVLEHVVEAAPRTYDVVVLSDHGQALGATFEQVEGRSLLDTVRALMAPGDGTAQVDGVQAADGEEWGPVNALLTSLLDRGGEPAVLGPGGARDRRRRGAGTPGQVREHGRTRTTRPGAARADADVPEVVVVGSGNLGLVWFAAEPARLLLEDVQERWPRLVPGLAARPGVGVVVVDSRAHGLVAVGARGLRVLEPGPQEQAVQGEDPLAPYGTRARADLLRAARLPRTGDLLLLSSVDPGGRVHAFEGQVGSHGGTGGAQNDAFVLHPAHLVVDDALREDVDGDRALVGADAVHRQLVAWLAAAGLRGHLRDDDDEPGHDPDDAVGAAVPGRATETR